VWFQAIALVTQNRNSVSALSLTCQLAVSQRSASRVKHLRLEAMAEREDRRPRIGTGVTDTADPGGAHAVELDEDGDPRQVRFDRLPDYGCSKPTWTGCV